MADSSTQPSHPRRSEPISKPAGLHLKKRLRLSHVWGPAHYRKVEHQQGPASYALAPVKKNIYSLTDLRHILLGATAATSNTSPVWTTSRLASERSTVSP